MKNLIGILLGFIGFFLVIGGITYGAYLLHPVLGVIIGGGFLYLIGLTIGES